ncbi:MAG: uracil-DNA glycosylase, partial [Planctomycetota bacterium]|nr:uracil-DNA glycosylase [Planctomycetota bacterium]
MGAGADPLRQLIARIEMLEYSGIRFLVLPRVSRADSVSGITPGEASFQEGDPGSRNADTPGLNGHSATPVPPPGAVAASPEGEVARGDRIVQDAARNWKNSPAASPGAAGLKGKSTDAMAPGAAAESGTSRTEALQAASGRGPETIRVRREDSLFDAAAAGGSRGSKKEALDAVRARAMACTLCPLHKTRTHVVFGDGNPEADLVFVGEAPGADEDAQGLPFVGRAGQLLNKMIAAMGLKREEVY